MKKTNMSIREIKDSLNLKMAALVVVVLVCYTILNFIVGVELCPFRAVTGFPCPSCGLTTALYFILRGQFLFALETHIFIYVLPIVPLAYLFLEKKRRNQIYIVLAIALTIYWIYRLAFLFPSDYPMTFDPNGILPKLLNW